MKRIICYLLFAAGMLGILAGCSTLFPAETEPLYTDTLSENKRYEIMEAWAAKTGANPGKLLAGEGNIVTEGLYYYGTYDGYDYLFADSMLFSKMECCVGEEFFFNTQDGRMWVYHDGAFTELRLAYNDGTVPDDVVAEVAQKHYDHLVETLGAENVEEMYESRGYGGRYNHSTQPTENQE